MSPNTTGTESCRASVFSQFLVIWLRFFLFFFLAPFFCVAETRSRLVPFLLALPSNCACIQQNPIPNPIGDGSTCDHGDGTPCDGCPCGSGYPGGASSKDFPNPLPGDGASRAYTMHTGLTPLLAREMALRRSLHAVLLTRAFNGGDVIRLRPSRRGLPY